WSTPTGVIESGGDTDMAVVSAAGVYQLLVENANGCRDSTSVTVTLDAGIPTADAGADQTLTCTVTSVILGGASTTGPTITYAWTTPDGNIVGATDGIMIEADAVGEYNLTVRDESNGCQATDRVLVGIDTMTATITL